MASPMKIALFLYPMDWCAFTHKWLYSWWTIRHKNRWYKSTNTYGWII